MYGGHSGAMPAIALALIASSSLACSDPGSMTAPAPSASRAVAVNASGLSRLVNMMDACDGPSFNLAIGPGTCLRTGGVPFDRFVADLTRNQSAGAWHNAPSIMDAKLGETLVAVNRGGEVHTFTRVAHFGGGIVPFLNTLSGTPDVAPECTTEHDFVPPGGTDTETLDHAGTVEFQCCIHPWMRTTVRVRGS